MGQKLSCDIVKDLLPSYVEKLTSEEANESIRGHLKECPPCMDIYFAMEENMNGMGENNASEVKEFKSFLKYTKLQVLSSILYMTGILGILVCFIVNVAIDRKLTWSLLTAGGILLVLLPLFIGRRVDKRKIESAYGVLVVLLLPYLKLIEVISNRYFLSRPIMWFWTLALPLAVLWIVVIAFAFILGKRVRWNIWFSVAGLLALCFPASVLTQFHIVRYHPYNMDWVNIMINGISMAGAIILFFVVGVVAEHNKKRRN